ncbi:hypothetical protein ACWGST_11505 [Agromyces sp. NPDC055520]
MRLPKEYVAEHTHLAYASTAYGMQGATVCESNTILGDAMDAAGVYVGMTRGRNSNRLQVVAADRDDAREQFVFALERDHADRGLANPAAAPRESVRGLAAGTDKRRREARLPDGTRFGRNFTTGSTPEVGLRRRGASPC